MGLLTVFVAAAVVLSTNGFVIEGPKVRHMSTRLYGRVKKGALKKELQGISKPKNEKDPFKAKAARQPIFESRESQDSVTQLNLLDEDYNKSNYYQQRNSGNTSIDFGNKSQLNKSKMDSSTLNYTIDEFIQTQMEDLEKIGISGELFKDVWQEYKR